MGCPFPSGKPIAIPIPNPGGLVYPQGACVIYGLDSVLRAQVSYLEWRFSAGLRTFLVLSGN